MTPDFRALCAELVEGIERHVVIVEDAEPFEALLDRACAALAEPDPVADFVASQVPMPDDMRDALSAPGALWSLYEGAALAEGAGVAVTDEELIAFARSRSPWREWMESDGSLTNAHFELAELLRAAIARYGTHPRPIPVSERLPTEADCDKEGKVWWWYPETIHFCGYWQWEADAPERDMDNQPVAWLPAGAIPLPEVEP